MTAEGLPETAKEFLFLMREAGFILKLNAGRLEVLKAHWIDDDLADLIRLHKVGLIELLECEASKVKYLHKPPAHLRRGFFIATSGAT